MMGKIQGYRINEDEDRLFSNSAYTRIYSMYRYCTGEIANPRVDGETKRYQQGRLQALSTALEDLIVRDDTRIRGAAEAYQEILGILDEFVVKCKEQKRGSSQ